MIGIGLGYLGVGLGAGLCVIGAALGIGKLAGSALEGMARQPEAMGNLRTSMLIPAVLIEGLGFFALVICLLVWVTLGDAVKAQTGAAAAPVAAAQAH